MNDAVPAAPGARPADGWFFEDYALGQRFAHPTPRTITAGDCAVYLALTGARAPVHCAEPVAKALGHPSCPVDDLLVFHIAFGKTVHDISYNAIANLGYANLRFLEPVYVGDTLTAQSEVIGVKENSSGKSGIVYVGSRALNQHGREVLSWTRWVMVTKRRADAKAPATVIPAPGPEPTACALVVPAFLKPAALDPMATGGARLWEDYGANATIEHPGAMTLEESEHMMAARLYQNTARVHFAGKRLAYGGHVISICRALSHDGLENAFAIAAINGGTHANPTYAGDTLSCRHVVLDRWAIPGRTDVGALRLQMLGLKNQETVVLDLDYTVLIPRRKAT